MGHIKLINKLGHTIFVDPTDSIDGADKDNKPIRLEDGEEHVINAVVDRKGKGFEDMWIWVDNAPSRGKRVTREKIDRVLTHFAKKAKQDKIYQEVYNELRCNFSAW